MLESRASRTKILATLGPATAAAGRVRDLIRAGVDGFRINMSHGRPEERSRWIRTVQRLRRQLKRPVSIVVDIRGPRLRLGRLETPRRLERKEEVVLVSGRAARGGEIPVDYPAFHREVGPGQRILLRDGMAELKILAVEGRKVRCRVLRGAELASNQGVNLPETLVRAPALSARDRADLAFAAEHGAEWIAMSFVRTPEDLGAVRRAMARHGWSAPVIAKIECREAVRNLDAILAGADAAMVARGDLAVEVGHEAVPFVQKRIIRKCIQRAIPVVIATQMLESMVERPQPTRAEVSDVANAAYDGADVVMLSGETAVGAHPVRAVRTMHRILLRTESEIRPGTTARRPGPEPGREGETGVERATVNAAVTAARQAGARVLLAFTESGRSARLVGSYRSSRTLIGLTSREESYHRMALMWGVRPALMGRARSLPAMYREAARTLAGARWLRSSDLLVCITGTFAISGATNSVRLLPLSRLSRAASAQSPRKA